MEFFAFIALAVVIGVIGLGIAHHRTKLRNEQTREVLSRTGLAFHIRRSSDPEWPGYEAFTSLKLKHGLRSVRWYAEGAIDGHELRLIHHVHTESSGTGKNRSSTTYRYTIAATPCPPGWPSTSLTRKHFGHRVFSLFGKRDIEVESEAFNKRWWVQGDDPEFVTLLLCPDLQDWLAERPGDEQWTIQGGWLFCRAVGHIKPEQIVGFARRPLDLFARTDPALDGYTTA